MCSVGRCGVRVIAVESGEVMAVEDAGGEYVVGGEMWSMSAGSGG